jgi:hypothetical protein
LVKIVASRVNPVPKLEEEEEEEKFSAENK